MEPDDELIFGRALEQSRLHFTRIESLRATATLSRDLSMALAVFELHGATLHRLAEWYPNEIRVRLADMEWDLLNRRLDKPVATVE